MKDIRYESPLKGIRVPQSLTDFSMQQSFTNSVNIKPIDCNMKPNQIDEYSKSPRKLGQDDAYNLRGEIKANKATIDQVKNILQLSG